MDMVNKHVVCDSTDHIPHIDPLKMLRKMKFFASAYFHIIS